MLARAARRVPSKSCLRARASVTELRSLSTSGSAPKPSHLLSDGAKRFTGLNVNSLKSELKRRGLPVSGRKAQLIDRLVSFDATNTRSISSTARSEAKGDKSTIDFMHMPAKKAATKQQRIKIPVDPQAQGKAPEVIQVVPEPRVAETVFENSATSVSGMGEISQMNADLGVHLADEKDTPLPSQTNPAVNVGSAATYTPKASTDEFSTAAYSVSGNRDLSFMNEDLGDGRLGANRVNAEETEAKRENTNEESSSGISGRDKTVLASIGAGVVAWWSTKLFRKKQ